MMIMGRQPRAIVLHIYYRSWLVSLIDLGAMLTVLQEVNNVLVVVTRYFGGIHLGADRFKHINQAARSALELGGFLDLGGDKKSRGMKKALYH